jgi:hypothetical protein
VQGGGGKPAVSPMVWPALSIQVVSWGLDVGLKPGSSPPQNAESVRHEGDPHQTSVVFDIGI